MLEIKPFTPSDLDVVTRLAREQDFAPGVGDIEPVGCIAAVTYNPGDAFIGLFAVKSEHQGQGVGRRLWDHALETLSNVACIGLEAAVQVVSFYEKAGFGKDCVTTRRQKMCLSDQSEHPNTSLLRRSDISVVPLRDVSLEAIQRYDERHEISPRPHFLEQWLRHKAGEVFVAPPAPHWRRLEGGTSASRRRGHGPPQGSGADRHPRLPPCRQDDQQGERLQTDSHNGALVQGRDAATARPRWQRLWPCLPRAGLIASIRANSCTAEGFNGTTTQTL